MRLFFGWNRARWLACILVLGIPSAAGAQQLARVISVSEVRLKPGGDAEVYSYRNKMEEFFDLTRAEGLLADAVAECALSAWRALGCRDAGRIDIRCDAQGAPAFIECNPLAGLRPGFSDLPILAEQAGMNYDALIGAILAEASARVAK